MLALMTGNISTMLLLSGLAVAAVVDTRVHRIPNLLSLSLIIIGFSLQAVYVGQSGLVSATLGLLVGFAMLLPFYAVKGMGAGDVKLMMAVGTFLGPVDVAIAVGFTLLCGSVVGLMILAWKKGAGSWFKRYWLMMRTTFHTLRPLYIPPAANEIAATRFPYAAAIAAGTVLALWWQLQLEPLVLMVESIWMR